MSKDNPSINREEAEKISEEINEGVRPERTFGGTREQTPMA